MNRRVANFLGLFACAGLMGYALFAQHGLELDPCPLCIFQRLGVIGLGCGFLLAALHNPAKWGARVYAVLLVLLAAFPAAVAGRHVWLQSLPADQVPSCGAGLEYLLDTVPLAEVLRQVFTGSGECAEIDWSFLGLSMPWWVLIAACGLGFYAVAANVFLPFARGTGQLSKDSIMR